MSDAAVLLALAERCEKAGGPDRQLDRDIAEAIGLGPDDTWFRPIDTPATGTTRGIISMDKGSWTKGGRIRDSARYTGSYDAAMSLVPTDGSMKLVEFSFTTEPEQPHVWPAASVRWYPPFKSGPDWHAMVVTASTLILTICAAALRARAAMEPTDAE